MFCTQDHPLDLTITTEGGHHTDRNVSHLRILWCSHQEDAEKGTKVAAPGQKGPLKCESEILQVWGKRETSKPHIFRTEETGKFDRVMTLLSFPTNTKGNYKLETSCSTPKKTKPTQPFYRRTWVPKMRGQSPLTLEHNFYYILRQVLSTLCRPAWP